MDRDARLAIDRGRIELESALCDLSPYMEDETLTARERRTIASATGKMADAVTQLGRMLRATNG